MILLFAFCGLLGVVFLTTEAIVVRKLLIRLVVPTGVCWLGLLVTTYFLFLNRRRYSASACLLITLLYTLAGNTLVAQSLAHSLERPYHAFEIEDVKSYDVVVLLGGGTMMGYHGQPQLGQSGDRVMITLQLYEAGKAKRVVCTGSQAFAANAKKGLSPGEQAQTILIRAGVPKEKIELIEGRTTSEEIQNLARLFQNTNSKVAVVSSAWHLPRVMRLAQRSGFQVDPIPANFLSKPISVDPMMIVPSAGNLAISGMLLKERLAQLVGQ